MLPRLWHTEQAVSIVAFASPSGRTIFSSFRIPWLRAGTATNTIAAKINVHADFADIVPPEENAIQLVRGRGFRPGFKNSPYPRRTGYYPTPLAKRVSDRQNNKPPLIGLADVMSTSAPVPLSSHGRPVDSFSR